MANSQLKKEVKQNFVMEDLKNRIGLYNNSPEEAKAKLPVLKTHYLPIMEGYQWLMLESILEIYAFFNPKLNRKCMQLLDAAAHTRRACSKNLTLAYALYIHICPHCPELETFGVVL